MSPGLADRLSAERRRKFVGRVAERDLFRSALFVLGEAAYFVSHARSATDA